MMRRLGSIVAILATAGSAAAQCQLQKLTPSDLRGGDQFGDSVAVSGPWMAVGASRDDEPASSSGSVTVFELDLSGGWIEYVKLTPTGGDGESNDLLGWSVGCDADALGGPVVVAGAQLDDEAASNAGAAYVFRYDSFSMTWSQEAKLIAPDAAGGDEFGAAVAVSGDVIVVGAPRRDSSAMDVGAVYVFRHGVSVWEHVDTLESSDGAESDRFGTSVAVDATDPLTEHVIAGAILHDLPPDIANAGAAYVYTGDGISWIEEKLTSPTASTGDKAGQSVAIAADVAVVSVHLDDGSAQNAGAAMVYRFDGSTWTGFEPERIGASDPSSDDQFGRAVAISEDGFWVAAGAPLDDSAGSASGSVYLYEWTDDTLWVQVDKLLATDASPNDEFGTSAALSTIEGAPEDAFLVVGASKDDDPDEGVNAGSTYVFTSAVDECSDCNGNLIPDINEIIQFPDLDCNGNLVLDVCEIAFDSGALGGPFYCEDECDPDCNVNGIPDECDVTDGHSADQNGNGIPDECEDCNGNGVPDEIDIEDGASDCNDNLVLDSCEIEDGSAFDCDGNGVPDVCDIDPDDPDGDGHVSNDCDEDGAPDECDDCNGNGIADSCDIDPADPDQNGDVSLDLNGNGIPDECEDCNENSIPDWFEIEIIPDLDCNDNGLIDDCEIVEDSDAPGGPYYCLDGCNPDCNINGVPDDCDISSNESDDVNDNGVPDECEDCNENGTPDSIDIDDGDSEDCNSNGIPDECEIHFSSQAPGGPFFCLGNCASDCNMNGIPDDCDVLGDSDDCDEDGVPDECEIDCNENGINDECDISSGSSFDLNENGVPDECDPDCDGNGLPDFAEILFGIQLDCNDNEIPDNCDVDPTDPDGNGEVSSDANGDGVPDECAPSDLDGDGLVGFDDLIIVLAFWGDCGAPCPADINQDGVVDFNDLLLLLADWS